MSVSEIRAKICDETFKFSDRLSMEFKDIWSSPEIEFGLEDILPEVQFEKTFQNIGEAPNEAIKYLISRDIEYHHVETYDIRYDPVRKRIVFPVKVDGRLLGWQSRYIYNETFVDKTGKEIYVPKIITSTGLQKDKVLMFQDRLKGSKRCILTEGPVSAIKCHKIGGNVASMGKAVSNTQLEIIKNSVSELYIGLDPDATEEIDVIARKLYGILDLYYLPPPNGKEDLGDASEDEVLEEFRHAKPMAGTFYLYF